MKEKIYDICIHAGGAEPCAYLMIKLKAELESFGHSVLLYSKSKVNGEIWESSGIKDYIVLPEYTEKIDVAWCVNWIRSHGVHNFRSLYRTERIFYGNKEEYYQNEVAKSIYALQSLAEGKKARYYFTYVGDEIEHNTFRMLCKMHNGEMIYFGLTNIDNRLYLTNSDERFFIIPKADIPFPSETQVTQLKKYIADYTSNKTILWGDPSERDINYKVNLISKFFTSIIKTSLGKITQPQYKVHRLIESYLKRLYRRQRAYSYYEKKLNTVLDRKFIYFPLHYPVDSQLTNRGIPFLNQAAIVEIVSQYVPYPYILLVKEHPHARGFLPISDMKKISRLPNVKLFHPFVNSHDIIPKATGIVAINSSVGYEGILYRKPVITLGKSFYRGHGLTVDIDSLYDLEKALAQIENVNINQEQVVQFLWRIIYHSYDVNAMQFLRNLPGEEQKVAKALDSWIKSRERLTGYSGKAV